MYHVRITDEVISVSEKPKSNSRYLHERFDPNNSFTRRAVIFPKACSVKYAIANRHSDRGCRGSAMAKDSDASRVRSLFPMVKVIKFIYDYPVNPVFICVVVG
jgi:hypothetical protein